MSEAHFSADRAQSQTQYSNIQDERSEFERRNDQEDQDALEDRKNHEEWAAKLKLSFDDLAVFTRHGYHYEKVPPLNTPFRRDLLAYLKREETRPPKWVMISGMYPDFIYDEAERRVRLRALYKALILLIRRALGRKEVDTFGGERSIYWDPVAEVCRDLEIAPSKLSAFCKEFSGHSLSQVVDCVRVERAKRLMRVQVREFVLKWKTQCATLAAGEPDFSRKDAKGQSYAKKGEEEKWVVWGELKKSRRWPEFSQSTWAMEFGFCTYRRMYRACIAVYGKTPHQLEMEMIVEVLEEPEGAGNSENEVGEMTLNEVEKLVKEIRAFAEASG